uniref:MYB transcription factor n=1 Tax=Melilotus albus TaxID=47082 RepID=A0A896WBY1_MELAB|nr:MYB family transcription factor [Melilotus albus]
MGNQKQKWTAEEEEALTKGVNKYGAGKWKHILKDPELSPKLASRSNIDLKDKWRNLNVFNGQNPRTPKGAASPAPNNATPSPSSSSAAAAAPAPGNAAVQNVDVAPQAQTPIPTPVRQPSQNDEEAKVIPKYNSLIYEALATIKDTNGSDLNAIIRFIEQKHNWPQNPNFRRTLGSKLRRLVSQGKLEKVLNGYKIKDTSVGTKIADDSKPPAPEETDLPSSSNNFFEQASSSNNNLAFEDALREASETLACRVAEVDNKSFLAAAAVKETERYAKFQEENDAMLMIAEELLAKCMLGGTVRFN